MNLRNKTLLFHPAPLFVAIGCGWVLSCSGSDETEGTDTAQQTENPFDAGVGGAESMGDDDLDTGGDDDSVGSDDDIVGDDDGSGGTDSEPDSPPIGFDDGDGGAMLDASAPDSTPDVTLPGDGFVTIDEGEDGDLEILCGSEPCACADGIDNDGDGLVDGLDSECTGPFDHDEGTFATGIPGDNRDPKWQDCFFDGNSGAGDDQCRYHTGCLTGDISLDAPECSVTEQCRDFCAPLAPPGCDCFGCCEINNDGESLHIIVSETCSLQNIDDEQACPRCVPTDLCANECGECEICLGETLADLPESCFPPDDGSGGNGSGGGPGTGGGPGSGGTPGDGDGGEDSAGGSGSDDPPADDPPPNVCDNDARSCVLSEDCGSGAYCSLGCCKTLPAR